MARDARGGRPAVHRPRVQVAALVVAGVFLLIGVLGYIPGITTDYGELRFGGHHSDAKLLGLFQVSILHNAIHLIFGLAGLVLARSVAGARVFLAAGGAIYLALWLYGLVIEAINPEGGANILPVNDADNWLHLALGFGMLALGLLLSNEAGTGGRLDNPADRH
ncbi:MULTISPECIES: DUF4383 domain-containing protein [unclassified Micromonospora]|uniref:DUF4383 domain-containing protein n=1 Tax=unclassified Micromonospora TaxID=2617518 RepID=UPI00249CF148|nr:MULTISPECIES: DUF4383 domain-containing protein [unclassified Micromonospora]WFE52271.1 DUF4383 domain-containing protein [Micromonospora sp. WMMD1155]WFF00968.1 DUF4383 domain-containing protein [Micromonospora sp. WMMD964]